MYCMDKQYFTKTLKLRIKDKHASFLLAQSKEVNLCWNFVNDLSQQILRREHRFCSAYDLAQYTCGATKEGLSLHSQTVQAINEEYVLRRKQFRKAKLRWRKSGGSRRSLGWIPFKSSAIKYHNGQIKYCGRFISLWDSYGLARYELGTGSFSEDARGRWYFNVTVKVKSKIESGTELIGVDLGCKAAATASNGNKVIGRRYQELEKKLGVAQRARNKARVKSIHAKIANRRQDDHHKFSSALVKQSGAIFVGNVSSPAMRKTKLAKSSSDAGWGLLKTMLEYKCRWANIVFEEVNEAYTTQTCSCCGCISPSSPKGRAGLGIRHWNCMVCGADHDRDVNAAINIAKRGEAQFLAGAGHCPLVAGIPVPTAKAAAAG